MDLARKEELARKLASNRPKDYQMIRPCFAKPGHRQAAAKALGQVAGTD